MGYKVIIQDSAIQDLDEIAFYIAKNLQEPQTALKVVRDIRDVIDGLKTMPERYKLVDDEFRAVRGIRVAQSRKYLIFYTVNKAADMVHVLNIKYGKREWMELLNGTK